MRILGLVIMTERALARSMKQSVAGGVALGRIAGKYGLAMPDDDITAGADAGEIYELGVRAGRELEQQVARSRVEGRRLEAVERSRERRRRGHLRVVGDETA